MILTLYGCPAVADWYARVKARPAFKEAFCPGTRLSELHTLKPPTGARSA